MKRHELTLLRSLGIVKVLAHRLCETDANILISNTICTIQDVSINDLVLAGEEELPLLKGKNRAYIACGLAFLKGINADNAIYFLRNVSCNELIYDIDVNNTITIKKRGLR